MLAFDYYAVRLRLIRPMLATNPLDPNVRDVHILMRSRKIISGESKINSTIKTYTDAIPPSEERREQEMNVHLDKLEKMYGVEIDEAMRKDILAGNLDKLKETIKELGTQGTTIFFHDKKTNRPAIGDHMILGYLKAAADAIGKTRDKGKGKVMESVAYTVSVINQHVKVVERFIPFSNDLMKDDDGNVDFKQRPLRANTAQGPRVTLAKSEQVDESTELNFTLKVLGGSPLKEEHLRELFSYGELSGLGQWRNVGYGSFVYALKKLDGEEAKLFSKPQMAFDETKVRAVSNRA